MATHTIRASIGSSIFKLHDVAPSIFSVQTDASNTQPTYILLWFDSIAGALHALCTVKQDSSCRQELPGTHHCHVGNEHPQPGIADVEQTW